jgi:hypothetical protein
VADPIFLGGESWENGEEGGGRKKVLRTDRTKDRDRRRGGRTKRNVSVERRNEGKGKEKMLWNITGECLYM